MLITCEYNNRIYKSNNVRLTSFYPSKNSRLIAFKISKDGGDQEEIIRLFSRKSLLKYFDVGIFGSPDSKEEIVARELKKSTGQSPALFIGDSKYDYQVAKKNNLDFIFLILKIYSFNSGIIIL